eukprot:9497851-Pyramimonas_sp.AAC.2
MHVRPPNMRNPSRLDPNPANTWQQRRNPSRQKPNPARTWHQRIQDESSKNVATEDSRRIQQERGNRVKGESNKNVATEVSRRIQYERGARGIEVPSMTWHAPHA